MKKKIYLSESEFLNVVKRMVESSNDEDIALAIGAEGNSDLALAMSKDVNEDNEDYEDDYNPRQDLIDLLKSKIESGEELDESDVDEIYLEGKPFRTGRGSIYVDIMVPETDDKEFDREVAKKMLEYYSKQIKNENYVGGLGFKNQGNLIQPYDNMDF
jgi:hypothetical protein